MSELINIKNIIEFAVSVVIAISALILLIRLLFKKVDKNNNGKIEQEEITTADMEFCKALLKESIKTIALGMYQQGGMTSKQVNEMILKEIKNSKTLIEETIKQEEKKGNEKNS